MRLFLVFFTLTSTALAGTGIIAVLSAGLVGTVPIIAAAAIGVVLALPLAWVITRKVAALG
jgi:hypothetical protein